MVNIGDKIVVIDTEYFMNVPNGTVMTVQAVGQNHVEATVDDGDGYVWFMENGRYEPCVMKPDTPTLRGVSPKLWKDMTPEEKGALLLAHHEGKTIECYQFPDHGWEVIYNPVFDNTSAYRIKPEPKRVTVALMADFKEIGTIDLIDGIPDPDSIKITGV
jgi:hypothetical protein